MGNFILTLDARVQRVENVVLAALMGLISVILFVGVVFRYLLNSPFTWTEELVTIFLCWTVFIGASLCFRSRQHIVVDSLTRLLPRPLQVVTGSLAAIVTLVIIVLMIWLGFDYAHSIAEDHTAMLDVSMAWGFLAMPVMFLFSLIHIVSNMFEKGIAVAFENSMSEEVE